MIQFLCTFNSLKRYTFNILFHCLNNYVAMFFYCLQMFKYIGRNLSTELCFFTTEIINENRSISIRGFKDTGSQRTLVCNSVVDQLNPAILEENIPLTIQGFNTNQRINTKKVLLKIVISGQVSEIPAICVDRIKTRFKVDGSSYI